MLLENLTLTFLIFMTGASIASFIFVYLERGGAKDFLKASNRSLCGSCSKTLRFYEVVPIFSFIFSYGRCLRCKSIIPRKLFIGELVLGIWFVATASFFISVPSDIYYLEIFLSWVFGSVLFALVVQDLESMEVSGKLLYTLLSLAIFISIVRLILNNNIFEILFPLAVFSIYWIIYFVNDNWIGEADPYVFTSIGLFFGSQLSISLFYYSVWFGVIFAAIYLLIFNKKIERNIQIPFLPIIFFSTLFILITDYHIIQISDILILNEILFS